MSTVDTIYEFKTIMSNKYYIPKPVFDTLDNVIEQYKTVYADNNPRQKIQTWLNHCFINTKISIPSYAAYDYQLALNFLYSYRSSNDTFTAYRREIERFLQWSWFVREQSVLSHKRDDLETFIEFSIKPYKRWIGLKNVARFKFIDGEKRPNPEWRPFVVQVNKKDHKQGIAPDKNDYQLSQQALKAMFGILSSFYNFLLQDEIVQHNPVVLIRQKSKFLRNDSKQAVIRRLTEKQWQTVLNMARDEAKNDVKHERTVFILSLLYGMYLRISELVSSHRWTPTMNDFYKDNDGNWWFKTVGKGNKAREIAVSDAMLSALKHYRIHYLQLPPYPSLDEKTPLIGHLNNPQKPICSDRPIRHLVQSCFDKAANKIELSGDSYEANLLRSATVHWLRHTGISDDVKHRPREHVRDDAGHSSSMITDKYIDIELRERHKTAKKKVIIDES